MYDKRTEYEWAAVKAGEIVEKADTERELKQNMVGMGRQLSEYEFMKVPKTYGTILL